VAIRVFLTTWSVIDNTVINPVTTKVETLPPLAIVCSMVYPDAGANGLPDGPRALVIVDCDTGQDS